MKLGKNLRSLRVIKGIDQIAAAEQAVIDPKTLRKAENGELCLNEGQVERLAKLYGVHVSFLRHFDHEYFLALSQKLYFLQQAHGLSNEEVLENIKLSFSKKQPPKS